MLPRLDLPRALLRGRYMAAAAAMEHVGTPIDVQMLARIRECWTDIPDELIAEIDADYQVYEGRTFKTERFARWLVTNNIPWRRAFIAGVGCSTLWPIATRAQQLSKIARVGILSPANNEAAATLSAFRSAIHDLGYVEEKTIMLDFRLSKGNLDGLSALAAELVRIPVDVIVTDTTTAARSAFDATKTIPIVMAGLLVDNGARLSAIERSAPRHCTQRVTCATMSGAEGAYTRTLGKAVTCQTSSASGRRSPN
jgi:hypothetical protein